MGARKRMGLTAGVAAVLAIVVLAFGGGPAGAQVEPEPPYTGVLGATIERPNVGTDRCANDGIRVQVADFQAGATATFTIDETVELGSATVAADGTAVFTFDVPDSVTPGTHKLYVTGLNSFGVEDEFVLDLPVEDCSTDGGPNGPGGPDGNGNQGTDGTNGSNGTNGTNGNGSDTQVLGANLARTGTDISLAVRLGVAAVAAGAALLLITHRRRTRSV